MKVVGQHLKTGMNYHVKFCLSSCLNNIQTAPSDELWTFLLFPLNVGVSPPLQGSGAMTYPCLTLVQKTNGSVLYSCSHLDIKKPQDFDVFFRASRSGRYLPQSFVIGRVKSLRSMKAIYRSRCCS